jgi:hypothetical protein
VGWRTAQDKVRRISCSGRYLERQGLPDKPGTEEMVERKGIEPSTFALRTRRSPS